MQTRAWAILFACGVGCTSVEQVPTLEPPPPGVLATPRWLTFTCVAPGCNSARAATVSVVGGRDIAIKRVVLSDRARDDFDIELTRSPPFVLRATESFDIRATHRPTGDPRLADVDVVITYTDASATESPDRIAPGELLLPLVRRLIGEPELSVDPPLMEFGAAPPQTVKTLPLSIGNAGFGNVGVIVTSVETEAREIRIDDLPAQAILPGTAWPVAVHYEPMDERYTEALIRVASADPTAAPAIVAVVATSILRPSIALLPDTAIDFGAVPVGGMAMTTFEIANRGADPLEISKVEITGDGGQGFRLQLPGTSSTAIVASLASIPVSLRLSPNVPGVIDARLRIECNDPLRTVVEVPVAGLATKPTLQVTPSSIAFGVVPRGWTKTERVEIENSGYGGLIISGISMVVGSSELFTILNLPRLPITLAHQERRSFEIEFRSEAQAGFSGTIALQTNDADAPYTELPVSARGASCAEGCPIRNGTPTCASEVCAIGACDSGWYDTDSNAATGCECAEIDRDPGSFCADGHWAGILNDGDGDSATFTGVLSAAGDIDMITFFAEDGSQVFSEDFDVRIRLETADTSIQMCVYRHNTGQHDNGCFLENESCGPSFRRDGTHGSEDGADYVVKILRRAGAEPTCTPYTVFLRNG